MIRFARGDVAQSTRSSTGTVDADQGLLEQVAEPRQDVRQAPLVRRFTQGVLSGGEDEVEALATQGH
jgi:hypothetical protein